MLTKPLLSQHIDVPVADLSRSKRFYMDLGFKLIMASSFFYEGYEGQIAMMRKGNLIVELYQLPERAQHKEQPGSSKPITFPVDCINTTFTQLQKQGYSIVETAPLSKPLRAKECRYFTVLGPDGERMEFHQIVA